MAGPKEDTETVQKLAVARKRGEIKQWVVVSWMVQKVSKNHLQNQLSKEKWENLTLIQDMKQWEIIAWCLHMVHYSPVKMECAFWLVALETIAITDNHKVAANSREMHLSSLWFTEIYQEIKPPKMKALDLVPSPCKAWCVHMVHFTVSFQQQPVWCSG